MDLGGIISVSGMSGLYKVVAQIKNGLIVESLLDQKRVPVYSTNKVSALEEVNVYSNGDDVPLKDVFQMIYDKEKGGVALDPKSSNDELKGYFKDAFADFDQERVYVSDIKKILMWYNLLHKEGLLNKKEVKEEAKSEIKEKPVKAKTASAKTKVKETTTKPVKTAGAKVKVQTVRKAGI